MASLDMICSDDPGRMLHLWTTLFLAFVMISFYSIKSASCLDTISTTSSSGQASTGVETCYNDKGDVVKHGEQFIPHGIHMCTHCTCMHGKAELCISVLCSPPENCRKYHEVTNKCCEFLCLDDDMSSTGLRFVNKTILTKGDTKTFNTISTSNLGLRLIASTITSFLILALLLFMIHRLRQRRLLLMIRRLQTRRLEQITNNSSGGGSTASEHGFRFGYFGSHNSATNDTSAEGPFDFGYIEPPPPYSFWKPPEQLIAPGEAPPSYEETVNSSRNNNDHVVNFDGNLGPLGYDRDNQAAARQYSACNSERINPYLAISNNLTSLAPFSYQLQTPSTSPSSGVYYPGRVVALSNGAVVNVTTQSPPHLLNCMTQTDSTEPVVESHHGSGLQEQTYSKSPYTPGAALVRHNSVPMSANHSKHLANGRHHHVTDTHHRHQVSLPVSSSGSQYQHCIPQCSPNVTNSLCYPQRLITHLTSSLTDSTRAFITSPIIDTISSEPNYEHITVVRIGTGAGNRPNCSTGKRASLMALNSINSASNQTSRMIGVNLHNRTTTQSSHPAGYSYAGSHNRHNTTHISGDNATSPSLQSTETSLTDANQFRGNSKTELSPLVQEAIRESICPVPTPTTTSISVTSMGEGWLQATASLSHVVICSTNSVICSPSTPATTTISSSSSSSSLFSLSSQSTVRHWTPSDGCEPRNIARNSNPTLQSDQLPNFVCSDKMAPSSSVSSLQERNVINSAVATPSTGTSPVVVKVETFSEL